MERLCFARFMAGGSHGISQLQLRAEWSCRAKYSWAKGHACVLRTKIILWIKGKRWKGWKGRQLQITAGEIQIKEVSWGKAKRGERRERCGERCERIERFLRGRGSSCIWRARAMPWEQETQFLMLCAVLRGCCKGGKCAVPFWLKGPSSRVFPGVWRTRQLFSNTPGGNFI